MERRYQTSRALAASNEESGSNSAAPSQSLGCRCLDQCRELGHGSCKDADTCRFGHDCEVATSSYSHQQILNSASPGKLLYHSDAVVPQKPGQPYWLENGAQEQKSETVSMGWNNSNVCSEHSTSVTISEAAVEHAQADISQAPSMAGLATQNQLPSNLNCYRTCHDPQYEARPPYSLIADALHKLDDDRARATGRMDTPDLYTHFHHQSCGSAVAMTGAQSSEGQATNGCQVADRRPFHTGGNIPLSDPAPRTPNRVRKASRHQVSESVTRNIQLDLARNYGIRHLGSLSDPVPYVRSPSSLSYYSSCDSITWTSSSPGRSSHPSSNGGHDSIAHATNLVVDLRSVIEAHSRWLDVLCPERSSSFYLRREAISTGQHGKLTSNWCDQLDKTSIPSAICRNCHVASGASSINATANIQKEHATAFMEQPSERPDGSRAHTVVSPVNGWLASKSEEASSFQPRMRLWRFPAGFESLQERIERLKRPDWTDDSRDKLKEEAEARDFGAINPKLSNPIGTEQQMAFSTYNDKYAAKGPFSMEP